MAIDQYYPVNALVYMGLSTDKMPANAKPGTRFIAVDTSTVYLFFNNGVGWTQVSGFGLLGN